MQALSVLLFAGFALCAYGLPSGRIVGGEDAPIGKYPYQVSLKYNGNHLCGGSIINKRHILTAAHCLVGRSAQYLVVNAGTNFLNETGQSRQAEAVETHPDYDSYALINDVGLITLKDDLEYNDKVQPIELLEKEPDHTEEYDTILTGWGRIYAGGPIPNALQHIKLRTTTLKSCQASHWRVKESHICTLTQKGEGACHGDSGGPLVNAEGKQVGIVSFGYPCALGEPDVYTRVSYHFNYIKTRSSL